MEDLDRQVAEALGYEIQDDYATLFVTDDLTAAPYKFSPSRDWAQGGPLIEEHGITIKTSSYEGDEWCSFMLKEHGADKLGVGPTPLIAAMKALVASREGDES